MAEIHYLISDASKKVDVESRIPFTWNLSKAESIRSIACSRVSPVTINFATIESKKGVISEPRAIPVSIRI